MRRMSGIWPPSKPMRMEEPERAVWPLPPRPEVLPWPLDSPWPRRLRRCLAPGRGFKSCKRIKLSCYGAGFGRFGRTQRFGSNGNTAAAINLIAQAELLQSVQRGFNDIRRVFRTERFAQDILHASRLEHGANGLAGDDTGSRRRRAQQNVSTAIAGNDLVGNGAVFQGDRNHLGLGDFATFADSIGDFTCLAETDADAALLVANNDESTEAETATTFDDLGGAINKHNLLAQFRSAFAKEVGLAFGPAPSAWTTATAAASAKTTTTMGAKTTAAVATT